MLIPAKMLRIGKSGTFGLNGQTAIAAAGKALKRSTFEISGSYVPIRPPGASGM